MIFGGAKRTMGMELYPGANGRKAIDEEKGGEKERGIIYFKLCALPKTGRSIEERSFFRKRKKVLTKPD